jgi:hypothetical protein
MIALFLFAPVLILPGMLLLEKLERATGRSTPGGQPRYEDYEAPGDPTPRLHREA